jgi:hypothetical protein
MTRELVLVHGRAQQGQDPDSLKAEWLDALARGLATGGLSLPILESDVRFPYYGDALDDLTSGLADPAAVVVRGEDLDDDERAFILAVLEEICTAQGITTQQVTAELDESALERGIQNWAASQALMRLLDRGVPMASGATIAVLTRDVYAYLRRSAVRRRIDAGVASAFSDGGEQVVIAHSLGTLVAYNVLGSTGTDQGWTVPLLVTVGSPLAVTRIRKEVQRLRPACCPPSVTEWFNALDIRDVVALYPLDAKHFPLDPAEPAITNWTEVDNATQNRHGISGYLDDPEVALRIYKALTSS